MCLLQKSCETRSLTPQFQKLVSAEAGTRTQDSQPHSGAPPAPPHCPQPSADPSQCRTGTEEVGIPLATESHSFPEALGLS